MPILNIKVAATPSAALSAEIAENVSGITARVLRKKPALISIALEYVDPAHWYIAGQSLTSHRKSTVYLGIKITDETNTKDEKARFIQETFDFFRQLLGELHEASYIHVEDVRAAAFGYGGRTQEYRYQASAREHATSGPPLP